jgi:hypothetical protein
MRVVMDENIFSSDKGKVYTNDKLAITITGPDKTDLQLLDLPGLIDFDSNTLYRIANGSEGIVQRLPAPIGRMSKLRRP